MQASGKLVMHQASSHARSPLAAPLPVPQTPELPEDQASVASSGSAASSQSYDVGVAPISTAAAVHEVPSLLSQLVSGHLEQQVRLRTIDLAANNAARIVSCLTTLLEPGC